MKVEKFIPNQNNSLEKNSDYDHDIQDAQDLDIREYREMQEKDFLAENIFVEDVEDEKNNKFLEYIDDALYGNRNFLTQKDQDDEFLDQENYLYTPEAWEDETIEASFEKDSNTISLEDISSEQDLGSFIESYRNREERPFDQYHEMRVTQEMVDEERDFDDWTLGDIIKNTFGFSNKNKEQEVLKNLQHQHKEKNTQEKVLQKEFENKKPVEKVDEQAIEKVYTPEFIYPVQVFKQIKEIISYYHITQKNPKLIELRPTRKKGGAFSDEEILYFIAENETQDKESLKKKYEIKTKDKDSWKAYERFLENCRTWFRFANPLFGSDNYKPYPCYPDGKAIAWPDLKKTVINFYKTKEKDPQGILDMQFELFAQDQLEKGNWKKQEFNFEESEFKGKKQWKQTQVIENRKGNPVEVTYVTDQNIFKHIPKGFRASLYYETLKMIPDPKNNKRRIEFIKIHFPKKIQEEKKKSKTTA